MKIYLAGPEVFLPKPFEIAERKKIICDRYGHSGIFPMDAPLPDDFEVLHPRQQAFTIYNINRNTMMGCDAVVANMTPFRGVSMDCGTAYEMGFMSAMGRPTLAYTNDALQYRYRVSNAFYPISVEDNDVRRDRDGMQIEDFTLADNLMLEGAMNFLGYEIVIHEANEDELWSDLTAFEKCVAML